MIYVVLQAVLKNDLYIRLTHNFHYRNPLLLIGLSGGTFSSPGHTFLSLCIFGNKYILRGAGSSGHFK